MPDLDLDRLADLVTTHPLASLMAALVLGLRPCVSLSVYRQT